MARQATPIPLRPPRPTWDGTPIRPTVATIDLDALASNFRQLKAFARGDVLAVVKADAYGHGAIRCAQVLEREGARFLGVALTEEGLELRAAGITSPMLVLGGAYGDRFDLLVGHDLTPVVFRPEHLEGLAAAARALGRQPVAHLKLDTGMGRIGVQPADLPAFLDAAVAHGVSIEGLATHFANADLADSALTQKQIDLAFLAAELIKSRGQQLKYVHLANSAATVARPEAHGSLVRPGIMLYGEMPSPRFTGQISLKPVMRWTTAITHLKHVNAGTPISYGSKWTAQRPSLVATLPVGYADGYLRALTNVGEVLVRGRRAQVAGTVCMDQMMIDVTDVPEVAVGDEVVLLGAQGEDVIGAEELAGRAGTIHYEVFCGIGPRVPRRFVGG